MTRDGDLNPVQSKTRFHCFQNPKFFAVCAYRYHYRVPSFIYYFFLSHRSCNVMLCPLSRVTAFKSNQSNHCRVSTNVFEWNCKKTSITCKTSEVWQLTLLARMAERAKIIYCKGGNTTSMAKHISIVHQIKAKCSTFDCLRVEKTLCPPSPLSAYLMRTLSARTYNTQ